MSSVHAVSDAVSLASLLKGSDGLRRSFLLFHTTWHPPSQQMTTVFQTLAKQTPATSAVQFISIDAEQYEDAAEQYAVESVPTLVVYAHGNSNNSNNNAVLAKVEGADVPAFTKAIQLHSEAAAKADQGNNSNSTAADTAAASSSSSTTTTAATAAVVSEDELNKRLKSLIESSGIMVFIKGTPTAPRCGFTKQLLALLDTQHIVNYGYFDILQDNAVREGLKKYSNWPTFPQVYVKGELVGGLDVVKELVAAGEFVDMVPDMYKKTAAQEAEEAKLAEVDLNTRLKSLINQRKLMLFMKGNADQPRCGFSSRAIQLLEQVGVNFKEQADKVGTFDILNDEQVRQGLKEYSNWPTYPQLYINGELIGGLDVMQEMIANEELQSMVHEHLGVTKQ